MFYLKQKIQILLNMMFHHDQTINSPLLVVDDVYIICENSFLYKYHVTFINVFHSFLFFK
jgi:hypothetical protein